MKEIDKEVKKVIYVTESKSFIINGVTIPENALTVAEAARFKKKAKTASLLIGACEQIGQRIV